MRVGFGFDVHRLVEGRPLVLGGVTVEYEKGLLGHSDADVLVHAIIDAVLGAAGARDIGFYFPDSDPQYAGISSMLLLSRVRKLLEDKGARLINVDAVVAAEKPRLAPYIGEMVKNIASCLGIGEECVNIKATTTEGLGFTGRGEGIAAYAVALVE